MARQNDNRTYAQFLRRALSAYAERVAVSDQFDLAEMVSIHGEMERLIQEAINGQLIHGVSWNQIADGLGMPASTARARWATELLPRGRVIYGLRDANQPIVRYVGKSKNVSARFAQHRASGASGSTRLARWISEIGPERLEVVILQVCYDDAEMDKAEFDWMDDLEGRGFNLLNDLHRPVPKRKGVGGRPKLTPEQKRERAEQRVQSRRQAEADLAARQAQFDARADEERRQRQAAYWEREIRAGRATESQESASSAAR